MKCSFCDRSSLSKRIIRENRLSFSILSDPRLAAGHCLILPKRHIEPPEALSTEELEEIYYETMRLTNLLLQQSAGTDFWQKTRTQVAESSIKRHHLHFHLIPSSPGEKRYETALQWDSAQFSPLLESERDQLLDYLR